MAVPATTEGESAVSFTVPSVCIKYCCPIVRFCNTPPVGANVIPLPLLLSLLSLKNITDLFSLLSKVAELYKVVPALKVVAEVNEIDVPETVPKTYLP